MTSSAPISYIPASASVVSHPRDQVMFTEDMALVISPEVVEVEKEVFTMVMLDMITRVVITKAMDVITVQLKVVRGQSQVSNIYPWVALTMPVPIAVL